MDHFRAIAGLLVAVLNLMWVVIGTVGYAKKKRPVKRVKLGR